MACGRVDGLCHARRGAITPAVVRRAEIGTTFHRLAWDFDRGRTGIVASLAIAAFRIEAGAARVTGVAVFLIPVRRPFPDIAGHVIESVAVRGKAPDRRGAFKAVFFQILPGEFTLPRIGHVFPVGRQCITPYELRSRQPASSRKLPLRLRRQLFADPLGVCFHVLIRDMDNGMFRFAF